MAGPTGVRPGTLGPTTRGCPAAFKHLPLQTNFDAEQDWRRGIGPDTQWQEHAGRRQLGFILDPLTTPPVRPPQVPPNNTSFHTSYSYAETYHPTTMHRLK